MGILDFEAPKTTNNARRQQANTEQKPPAKLWLNVGYEVETTDKDGNNITRFINLPVGIPLDTMEPLPIRGQNEEFAALRSAQNDLLKALQSAGDNLDPGVEKEVRLVVKIRKVNEQLEIKREDNPFAVDLASLIA